jgi:hypothetical protein
MYQPPVPLVPMSPAFHAAQLAELELGRLMLLRPGGDGATRPSLGMRVDALSAQGDLLTGVVRLQPMRFERCALDESVAALELDYVLEADLTSLVARTPAPGDLLVAARRPAAAVFLASVWGSAAGLLDVNSATIRPFGAAPRVPQVALGWRLVERVQRSRILFEHLTAEPYLQELPRRVQGEDCD